MTFGTVSRVQEIQGPAQEEGSLHFFMKLARRTQATGHDPFSYAKQPFVVLPSCSPVAWALLGLPAAGHSLSQGCQADPTQLDIEVQL